ncbi:hypothetical protein BH24ACT22_BH24ACT22_16510 [soil metagenome]
MSEGTRDPGSFAKARDMRNQFLGWQCRLRPFAVRAGGGRPTPGMMPRVMVEETAEALGRIVIVMVPSFPEESTTQFRYIMRKTQDPVERYEKGLKILQAEYYQRPRGFSDKLTALFDEHSPTAASLLEAERCTLDFEQYSQKYLIPCRVKALKPEDPFYQATYWHNHLFNPRMPHNARVLALVPDWQNASAEKLTQN